MAYDLMKERIKSLEELEIHEACNGEEAIQMVRECLNGCQNPFCTDKHYQLIVMDLQMPKMDGFEAAKQIHELYKTKIVALTAFTNQETLLRCQDIGFEKVYNKPATNFDVKEMMILHLYGLTVENFNTFQNIEKNINYQIKANNNKT